MVTDEMVEKAADAMARQDITFANCDRTWQRRTIRAALEAALSAAEPVQTATNGHRQLQIGDGAKPVAWVYAADLEKGDGCFGNAKGEVCMSRDGEWINVDTPLYATPPAPSVAVKALHQAASDFMHLFIQDGHLTMQDLEDTDLIPAYEKLSAALSAQVQDVTGSENPSHDAYEAWLKRNGYPHTVARALAFEHGWRAHKKFAAAAAKQEG